MLIKKLNDSTFDVFWNKGWESWARFQRSTSGALQLVGGKVMPSQLFQQFKSILNKKNKGRQIAAAQHISHRKEQSQPTEAQLIARFQK